MNSKVEIEKVTTSKQSFGLVTLIKIGVKLPLKANCVGLIIEFSLAKASS